MSLTLLLSEARHAQRLSAERAAELDRSRAAINASEVVHEARVEFGQPVALVLVETQILCRECGKVYVAPEGVFVDRLTPHGVLQSKLVTEHEVSTSLPRIRRTLSHSVNGCSGCFK